MTKSKIICDALEYYRNKALSDKVLDMSLAELSEKEWSREDIIQLLRIYADIDRIISKIKEADDYIKKVGTAETDDDISVNTYNILYFLISDLLR